MEKKIIVIVGPTASGKSAYAVKLGKKIGGEIISADSRQVYTGLNIGTGKITRTEMARIPHHLLDVASPKKVFTANDFVLKARPVIDAIFERGKTPIICGGTGFYIDALVGRISLPNVPPNLSLRKKLQKKTAAELFTLLHSLDSTRASEIDANNPVRLVRAIEIAKALGAVPPLKPQPPPYTVEWIGLKPDEAKLKAKIAKRLKDRMKKGMVREARELHRKGLSYKRMEQLGLEYRYLARFLQGKMSKDEMVRELEREICNYAKRQMAYWKKNAEIRWVGVK